MQETGSLTAAIAKAKSAVQSAKKRKKHDSLAKITTAGSGSTHASPHPGASPSSSILHHPSHAASQAKYTPNHSATQTEDEGHSEDSPDEEEEDFEDYCVSGQLF